MMVRIAVRILIAALAFATIGWIMAFTMRYGYYQGAADIAPAAYAYGKMEGEKAAEAKAKAEAFRDCAPWGQWSNRRVVICQIAANP